MRSRAVLLILMMLLALRILEATERAAAAPRSFVDTALVTRLLAHQKTLLLDRFNNGTASLRDNFDYSTGEARGKRKQLKKMNRTLMALVMAYTMKFIFLIPSFIGTLILLKFTVGLAGFFYALFAAVLGLDHQRHH